VTTIGGKALKPRERQRHEQRRAVLCPFVLGSGQRGQRLLGDGNNQTIRKGVPLPLFQSVTPVNGSLELIVNAAPGQTVQLQYSSDLTSATWTNLDNPITATGGTVTVTDTPGTDPRRFYRVLVHP